MPKRSELRKYFCYHFFAWCLIRLGHFSSADDAFDPARIDVSGDMVHSVHEIRLAIQSDTELVDVLSSKDVADERAETLAFRVHSAYLNLGFLDTKVECRYEPVTGRYQVHDLNEMGTHYAWTLREWRKRFQERIEEVRKLGFDRRFERMWDYYLGYCEGAFLERYIGVVQLLLVHQEAPVGVHGEAWAKAGTTRAGGMYSEG